MKFEWFLFEFAALLFIKSTVILVLGILGSRLLKSYQANVRYWLWSLVLVVVVMLPLLHQTLPTWEAPVIHPPGYSVLIPADEIQYSGKPTTLESVMDISGINNNNNVALSFWEYFLGLALLIWTCGAIILLAKLLADLLGLAVFSRQSTAPPKHWQTILLQAKQAVDCQLKVKIGISKVIGSPLIWGLFRPKILLPQAANQWSHERLKTVFLHELTHASRLDHILVLINQLAKCMYWSNPLVWYVVHQHGLERELSCDEQVVKSGKNHLEYAEELVAITRDLRKETKYASVAMTQQQGLAARIKSIVQQKDQTLSVVNRFSIKLITATSFIFLLMLASAGIVSKPSENSLQAEIQTLFGRDKYKADEAAKSLGSRGDKRAIPYLLKTAKEYPVPHTRMQSILAIGKLNDHEALQIMTRQFSNDPSTGVRHSLVEALQTHDETYVHQALQYIHRNDPDAGVQMRAYVALINLDVLVNPEPVFSYLNHPDEDVRSCAVNHTKTLCRLDRVVAYIDQHGGPSCQSLLIKAAGDTNPEIRRDAIAGLVNLGASINPNNPASILSEIIDADTKQRALMSLKEISSDVVR